MLSLDLLENTLLIPQVGIHFHRVFQNEGDGLVNLGQRTDGWKWQPLNFILLRWGLSAGFGAEDRSQTVDSSALDVANPAASATTGSNGCRYGEPQATETGTGLRTVAERAPIRKPRAIQPASPKSKQKFRVFNRDHQ